MGDDIKIASDPTESNVAYHNSGMGHPGPPGPPGPKGDPAESPLIYLELNAGETFIRLSAIDGVEWVEKRAKTKIILASGRAIYVIESVQHVKNEIEHGFAMLAQALRDQR
jgi:uncharacterized protein YlzI (FlbEa/FlbD family)